MADRIAKLRATLRELEEELAAIETLDDQTRSELEQAREEIEAALEARVESDVTADVTGAGAGGGAGGEASGGVEARAATGSAVERLRAATRDFEADHPNLTAIVQRTIDGLSQLGI
jgi:DNA repair exonuclease SbcCD ATPase subunit